MTVERDKRLMEERIFVNENFPEAIQYAIDEVLEQIEKSLMSDDEICPDYPSPLAETLSAHIQRNRTQSVINELKKG